MVLFLFFCVYVFALFAILTLFKTLEDSQLCTLGTILPVSFQEEF